MAVIEVVWKKQVSVFFIISADSINLVPNQEWDYNGVEEGKYNDGTSNHEEAGYCHEL